MAGNDGKGKRRKENVVIDWNDWSFGSVDITETGYSIEAFSPGRLFRSFKDKGTKFYLQGTYVLDDGDDYEEDEGIGNTPTKYLYPSNVRLLTVDGFVVRLYGVEERTVMKFIFDKLNARHDLGNLV